MPLRTRSPSPASRVALRNLPAGAGIPAKSNDDGLPSVEVIDGIHAGAGARVPDGSVASGERTSTMIRTLSWLPIPSPALPVSPNASVADAVTATREPVVAPLSASRKTGLSSEFSVKTCALPSS